MNSPNHTPGQVWHLRSVRTDGGTLQTFVEQSLDTLT